MTIPQPVFIICLLAALFAGIIFFIKRARYRRWMRASGTIIELIRRESTDQGSVTFSPRISFRTAAGETSEFVPSSSSFPAPRIGETMAVLYNPRDPREATIDSFVSRHVGEVVVFCLGMAGVLVYVYQRYAVS